MAVFEFNIKFIRFTVPTGACSHITPLATIKPAPAVVMEKMFPAIINAIKHPPCTEAKRPFGSAECGLYMLPLSCVWVYVCGR